MGDPPFRVVAQSHLRPLRIGPLPPRDLCLDQREVPLGITLARERLRCSAGLAVRAGVASLVATGRKLAQVAEAAVTFLVRHQVILRSPAHTSETVSGSTRPAST